MSSIASGTTSTTALVYTADTTGNLVLQTNGTTTAVTIDTNQNVGIGVTPSAWRTSYSQKAIQFGPVGFVYSLSASSTNNQTFLGSNYYLNSSGNAIYINSDYATSYAQTNGQHIWQVAPSGTAGGTATLTQAMTLDNSGNLLIGQTSRGLQNSNSFNLDLNSSEMYVNHASGVASGTPYILFGYNATNIGSITQNGTTGVLYNLTSDYRLKNNPVPVTGAKDFVMALQPKTWDWWDGSGKGVGFIAHEFMEVAKYSGHGEKDATKEEEYEVTPAVKDEQGNITTPAVMGTRTVPVYQAIQPSSSEVMANLVAYIQELSAEVTALKAKVGI